MRGSGLLAFLFFGVFVDGGEYDLASLANAAALLYICQRLPNRPATGKSATTRHRQECLCCERRGGLKPGLYKPGDVKSPLQRPPGSPMDERRYRKCGAKSARNCNVEESSQDAPRENRAMGQTISQWGLSARPRCGLVDLLVLGQTLVDIFQGLEAVVDDGGFDIVLGHHDGFQQDGGNFYLAIANRAIGFRVFAFG